MQIFQQRNIHMPDKTAFLAAVKLIDSHQLIRELVDMILLSLLLLLLQKANNEIKGIVHSKMKITPFTHPQDILGVYDFLLSDEYNRIYIKKCPGSSQLYNGSERGSRFWRPKKSASIHAPHGSRVLIKDFWS